MSTDARHALAVGPADALGFVLGGLLGWQAGRLVGLDLMAEHAGTGVTVGAWLLLLAGLAAGKWAELPWRARRR